MCNFWRHFCFVRVVVVGKTNGIPLLSNRKSIFRLVLSYHCIYKHRKKRPQFVNFLGNFGSFIRIFGRGMRNAHESILQLFELFRVGGR